MLLGLTQRIKEAVSYSGMFSRVLFFWATFGCKVGLLLPKILKQDIIQGDLGCLKGV